MKPRCAGLVQVPEGQRLHDYANEPDHEYYGVAEAVEKVVVPSGLWSTPTVTEYLWTAQRVA